MCQDGSLHITGHSCYHNWPVGFDEPSGMPEHLVRRLSWCLHQDSKRGKVHCHGKGEHQLGVVQHQLLPGKPGAPIALDCGKSSQTFEEGSMDLRLLRAGAVETFNFLLICEDELNNIPLGVKHAGSRGDS